jgi:hypothetical protein
MAGLPSGRGLKYNKAPPPPFVRKSAKHLPMKETPRRRITVTSSLNILGSVGARGGGVTPPASALFYNIF